MCVKPHEGAPALWATSACSLMERERIRRRHALWLVGDSTSEPPVKCEDR